MLKFEHLKHVTTIKKPIQISVVMKLPKFALITLDIIRQLSWFLEDDTDIRSSNCLEDTLTEFKVQGLEIDWACVAWDADLRLNKVQNKWEHFQLRSGTKWQNINKPEHQAYQINAY